MTLSPLIVALCVNTGPVYTGACKAALEQGASQSGFTKTFENASANTEQKIIRYINPSVETEMVAAVLGYSAQLSMRKSATLAVPNPILKNSAIRMTIGETEAAVNLRIDF